MATDTHPLAAGASQSDKCNNSPLAPNFLLPLVKAWPMLIALSMPIAWPL
jgi:hypothetical protein